MYQKLCSMLVVHFSNSFLRIPLVILAGVMLRFLLDLGFALIYRFYSIVRPVQEYLGAVLLVVLVFELVLLTKRWLNKRIPWEKGPTRRLVVEIFINTGLMSSVIIAISVLSHIYISKVEFIRFSDEAITAIFYLIWLVLIPAFGEFALFLLNRYRFGLAEIEKFKKENAEFQFETLRTQVNPHFLFNSLNTLSGLVYHDRDKAATFIRHMSDVYRYVLENRNHETISLRQEIEFIRAFVYLYELRFDKKLSVEINIQPSALKKLVAPMTLQLLIENAVKHNVVSARNPLKIRLYDQDESRLIVSNNLQPKPDRNHSTAVGLKNIVSRYAFLSKQPVVINKTETDFMVSLPLI
jgi:sensor histidine kinase YesM